MTIMRVTPNAGDTVILLDGDGNPSENLTLVNSVFYGYLEGVFEIEDNQGERFTISRYSEMDTDLTKGWIEVWLEEE